jgi:hypothetical protein
MLTAYKKKKDWEDCSVAKSESDRPEERSSVFNP